MEKRYRVIYKFNGSDRQAEYDHIVNALDHLDAVRSFYPDAELCEYGFKVEDYIVLRIIENSYKIVCKTDILEDAVKIYTTLNKNKKDLDIEYRMYDKGCLI